MDYLQMGQMMTEAARAVGPAGGGQRVQGAADGAVAQRVEMDLEALTFQRGDEAGQLARIDEVEPALAGGTAISEASAHLRDLATITTPRTQSTR